MGGWGGWWPVIVSAPVPVPFLWTLDLEFGTWILELDMGLGFGTWIRDLDLGLDLGLTINTCYVVFPDSVWSRSCRDLDCDITPQSTMLSCTARQ